LVCGVVGQSYTSQPQAAEERRPLATDTPEHPTRAVLFEQIEAHAIISVGSHVQAVFADWHVEHEAKTAARLSVRRLREKLVHAMLEPDLAMVRSRVVLEQHEWRPLHLI
jgi:hypothetical protein